MNRAATVLATLAALSLAGCGGGGDGGPTEPDNRPPDVTITEPADGSTFEEGQTVTFRGMASDPEQGSLSGDALVWTSDLDGRLGTGTSVEAPSLSRGDHGIALRATDERGATRIDSVDIAVVGPFPDQSDLRASGFAVLPGGVLTNSRASVVGRIRNDGGAEAGAFAWRVLVDGMVVASGRVDGIPARDSVELPVQRIDGFATRGTHTARLEIDTGDEVAEGSEANNAARDFLAVYPPGMDLELRFLTDVSDAQRQVFEDVARKWEAITPGDLEDVAADSFDTAPCIEGGPVLDETIDDLVLLIRLDSIDGPGNVLGQAGPCGIRENRTATVAVGAMELDSADVEQLRRDGVLEATVLHEVAHVLGFGTLWLRRGLLADTTSNAPFYVGRQAREAFVEVGGDRFDGNPVPVEGFGGQGTELGHWSEGDFQDELMTGFIQSGSDPFSIVSVGSMGDLKYATDPGEADAYTFPAARDAGLRAGPGLSGAWERRLPGPLFTIDPTTGRVRTIRPATDP